MSAEEVTADIIERARELELGVEAEGRTWMDEELLPVDEKRTWIPETESTPGGDAVTIVEMTTKGIWNTV